MLLADCQRQKGELEMKLNKLMIAIMVCCVCFLSKDAFAIRIPKKFYETASEHWYPTYGAAKGASKVGIRKFYKKDSLHRDSLRRNHYKNLIVDTHSGLILLAPSSLQTNKYDDIIDSKIDSIQSNFYKENLDFSAISIAENQSKDSLNKDIFIVSAPPKDSSEKKLQEKKTYDESSTRKRIAIVIAIVLLSVAIIKIYKHLPSKKDV